MNQVKDDPETHTPQDDSDTVSTIPTSSRKELVPPYVRKPRKLTGGGAKLLVRPALRRPRGKEAPKAGNR